jgi:hypothetical protein
VPIGFLDRVQTLEVADDERLAIEYAGGLRYVLDSEGDPGGVARDPYTGGPEARRAADARAMGTMESKSGTTGPAPQPQAQRQAQHQAPAMQGTKDSKQTKE